MASTTTVEVDKYAWLKKAKPSPPNKPARWAEVGLKEMISAITEYAGDVISFDFEANGLRWWEPKFEVVSLSVYFPDTQTALSVEFTENDKNSTLLDLVKALASKKLIAYNMVYDGGCLFQLNRRNKSKSKLLDHELLGALYADPLVLFRHCANDDYLTGHSLDTAQTDLLGWEDTQKDWLSNALEKHGLKKDQMSELIDIEETRENFLFYNAVDAYSAYMVWEHLASECRRIDKPDMITFHLEEFAILNREIIWQVMDGIKIDLEEMRAELINSYNSLARADFALRNHSEISDYVRKWEKEALAESFILKIDELRRPLADKNIIKNALKDYKVDSEEEESEEFPEEEEGVSFKSLPGPPTIGCDEQGEFVYTPVLEVSVKRVKGNKFIGFNFGSDDNKKELLYNHLARIKLAYTKKQGDDVLNRYEVDYKGKKVIVPATDSGGYPTGADIYPIFGKKEGQVGKLLEDYADASTRYGFCKSYLAAATNTGKIHPMLKSHGTLTGRCTGGSSGKKKSDLSVNVHQLPRSDKAFMSCFKAPPGQLFVSSDFCYHPDTELLTKRGWVGVMDVTSSDEVWQVDHKTLAGSWCTPKRIIKRWFDGFMFTFGGSKRGFLQVTENHKMLWGGQLTHKSPSVSNYRKVSLSNDGVPTGSCTTLYVASNPTRQVDCPLTEEEIWIACALQADGSICREENTYKIQVSTPKKVEKLTELLGPGTNRQLRACHNLPCSDWRVKFKSRMLDGKVFILDLLENSNKVDVFVEALSFWDGALSKEKTKRFSWGSTNEGLVDYVQSFLVRHGYEAKKNPTRIFDNPNHKPYHSLSIRKAAGIRLRPEFDEKKEVYSGDVGCVEVDTGFLLVRSHGQTFISGNCGLEKVVQAELSGDPVLAELYASGKVHDVHLFHTKMIHPSEEVRRILTSRYINDKEALDILKKEFAKERDQGKTWSFAMDYNSGSESLMLSSNLTDTPISLEQSDMVRENYRTLYRVYYAWCEQAKEEWKMNGRWIEDGFGFPIAISKRYLSKYDGLPIVLKDAGSKKVQRTGHYITLSWIKHIWNIKKEKNLWKVEIPVICDFHDERIARCDEDKLETVLALHQEGLDRLNEEIKPNIPFKIASEYGKVLYDCKKK